MRSSLAAFLLLAFAPLCLAETASDAPQEASEETGGIIRPAVRDRLDALGYTEAAESDPSPDRSGVVTARDGAWPGVNYYCTGRSLRFFDMEGEVLHEIPLMAPANPSSGCLAQPEPGGGLVVVRRPMLSVEEWDGRNRWVRGGGYHHDVAIDDEGRIYSFAARRATVEGPDGPVEILNQSINAVRPDAHVEKSVDLYPLFGDRIPEQRFALMARTKKAVERGSGPKKRLKRAQDVFHPNSIKLVKWPHAESSGRQALICFRDIDLMAVVDLDDERVLWEWGTDELVGPHDPWLLPSGNVLVFDNGSRHFTSKVRRHSRVVEVDPRTGKIVWTYEADPKEELFASTRSGSQPLPNGNVLITDSTKARVLEVTRAGETVWEYLHPERLPDGRRRSIYRMHRMSLAEFDGLKAAAAKAAAAGGVESKEN